MLNRVSIFLFSLACVFVIALLFPEVAWANPQETWPSEKMLPTAMAFFERLATNINANLSGTSATSFLTSSWAARIFYTCALLQGAVYLANYVLRSNQRSADGPDRLFTGLVRYLVFVGVGLGVLLFEGDITTLMGDALLNRAAPLINTHAGEAAGYHLETDGTFVPVNPAEVVKAGWRVSSIVYANASLVWKSPAIIESDSTNTEIEDPGWFSIDPSNWPASITEMLWDAPSQFLGLLEFIVSPDMWMMLIIYVLTVIAFYAIAFILVVAEISYSMSTAFLPLFLAFLPLRIASSIVTGYVRFYIYALIKLFAIYIFLPVMMVLPEVSLAVLAGTDLLHVAATYDAVNAVANATINSGNFDFTLGENDIPFQNTRARMDAILITGGLAICAAAVVKTVPQRLAEMVSSGFNLEPLYRLYD